MTRTIKIQSEYRESSNPINRRYSKGWHVPLLLLKGKWLEMAGFKPFQYASITVLNDKIIVEPIKEEP